MITGKDLIGAGFESGPWFKEAIDIANRSGDNWIEAVRAIAPPPIERIGLDDPRQKPLSVYLDFDADNAAEVQNFTSVLATMEEVLKTPGTVEAAIMPDACPAGPLGTIPVGGVVSSEFIHPGMHSADICCSMFITILDENHYPSALLDSMHEVTHFGPGGRYDRVAMPKHLVNMIKSNPFTREFLDVAENHFCTQGDGNHFAYVGNMESSGNLALVTHHGSRGFGAKVYKRAMQVAEKFRSKHAPEVLKQNAWLDPKGQDGQDYWEALQIVREWTYQNHLHLHQAATQSFGSINDSFWNEHNFVFQKSGNPLFYHAKGSTPAFGHWTNYPAIIPLNMTSTILIVKGQDKGMGFAPHGAGRNMSRSQHKRLNEGKTTAQIFLEETKGIDARFFSGNIDISELPSAYKNARFVEEQIHDYGLATIVDRVLPYGCIMAGQGDWENR